MTVAPYKDGTWTNDHTYYGRGCSNSWGTGGDGGSQTPCADSNAGGRYVDTADGETQKNGTIYNFQAGTDGSGAALDSQNANSSDTFCPFGWQLPYDGTGGDYYDKSKSWRYLFINYDIGFDTGASTDSTRINSYPFSHVYSGYYHWGTGRLYTQTSNGRYWSSTVTSSSAYHLDTWPGGITLTGKSNKACGVALRCALRTSS